MSKHFDKNSILGSVCARCLIDFDQEVLTDLPLGLKDKQLTEDFIKGFDNVVSKYKEESGDNPSLLMMVNAQRMVIQGHNRYKLVVDLINDSL